jgi:hypothetical protein
LAGVILGFLLPSPLQQAQILELKDQQKKSMEQQRQLSFFHHQQLMSRGAVDVVPTLTREAVVANEPKTKQTAAAADGCYHVFLDVGANIGVHGRFLLEPEKYPDLKEVVRDMFNKYFGSARDNRDICTFEIEANPKHLAALEKNSKAYEAMGWRYHVMNVGASDKDKNVTFYHQDGVAELGFSLKKRAKDARAVTVPVIRLASWVEQHVNQRTIPSKPYGDYGDRLPTVVMKMDIEGSEYIVLPDLMLSGALCGIDFIFGEFHPEFAPLDFPGSRLPLKNYQEVETVTKLLLGAIPSSRNCKTAIMNLDSEQYIFDGMPLPEPNDTVT